MEPSTWLNLTRVGERREQAEEKQGRLRGGRPKKQAISPIGKRGWPQGTFTVTLRLW